MLVVSARPKCVCLQIFGFMLDEPLICLIFSLAQYSLSKNLDHYL
jgi:hypothetical protein